MNRVKSPLFPKSYKTALLGIFLVALTLRLIFVFYYETRQESYWGSADLQYDQIATHIATGKGYYAGDYFEGLGQFYFGKEKLYSIRSPLYPYLLAALYILFGRSVLGIGIFQALMSSLIIFSYFYIGRRVFGNKIGLVAALAVALYPYSIFHDIRVFDTVLFEFFLGLLIVSILRLVEKPTWKNGVVSGVLMGLAANSRLFFFTFSTFFFLFLLLQFRGEFKKSVKLFLIVFLSQILVLAPWIVRNYSIHHTFLLSIDGGWNFFLGNNRLTMEQMQNRREMDETVKELRKELPKNLMRLKEAEIDQLFYKKGLEFIKNHPAEFFKLLWIKTLGLWGFYLNPSGNNFWKNLIYSLSYGSILFLSIPGILLSFKEREKYYFFYFLFFYFTISYIPFITLSRYRKPLDPYLIMFGLYGVIHFYQKFSGQKISRKKD